jgi:hypothetical protein
MMTALWIFTTFIGLCMSMFGALYLMYGRGWNDGARLRAAQQRESAPPIGLATAAAPEAGPRPAPLRTPGSAAPPAIRPAG